MRALVGASVLFASLSASAGAVTLTAATTKVRSGRDARVTFNVGTGAHACQITARAAHARLGPLRYTVSQPLVVLTAQVPRDARTLTWTLSVRCASSRARIARGGATNIRIHIAGRSKGAAVLFTRGSIHVHSYPADAVVGAEPERLKGGKGGYVCASAWDGYRSVLDASSYCTGYCTWFVWQKRPEAQLKNLGNAWEWWGGAKAARMPEGSVPVVGAVAWWGISAHAPEGHVAYVIAVSDSSVTIEEMNRIAWDASDTRTISLASSEAPNGYIYGGRAGNGPGSGSPSGGGSSGGGSPTGAPVMVGKAAVVVNNDYSQIDVFYRDTNGDLEDDSWSAASGQGYQTRTIATGVAGNPVAIANNSYTQIDVYYRATNGDLMNATWSDTPAGYTVRTLAVGIAGEPTAIVNSAYDQIDVYYRDVNGNLEDASWSATPAGYTVRQIANGIAGDPAAIVNSGYDQIDVFFQGLSGQLEDASWSATPAGYQTQMLPTG